MSDKFLKGIMWACGLSVIVYAVLFFACRGLSDTIVITDKNLIPVTNDWAVTVDASMNVKGIEKWITKLQGVADKKLHCAPQLVVRDPDTKAVFAIRRLK